MKRSIGAYWIIFMMTLMACSPFQLSTPPPSPFPLRVAITPSVSPIFRNALYDCAERNPGLALILEVTPHQSLFLDKFDIRIQIGEPERSYSGFMTQIGWDEIILIAGRDIKSTEIGFETIREIYTGKRSDFQIWTYPEQNEIRGIFDRVFLEHQTVSPYGKIAPSPEMMVEIIGTEPNSIGYIPKSWLNSEIKSIEFDSDIQSALHHPVLVLMDDEPKNDTLNFLACLQELTGE